MLRFALAKQMTTRNVYKNIYLFYRRTIVWSKEQSGEVLEIVRLSYLPTPPFGQDMTQGQFLSGGLTGLNSEFSFS